MTSTRVISVLQTILIALRNESGIYRPAICNVEIAVPIRDDRPEWGNGFGTMVT